MSGEGYLEETKSNYLFRCHDRSGSVEMLVDVRIRWSDFLSDLRREFGRDVNFTYRRDEQEVEVRTEGDFEEFCTFCDDEQALSMDIYIKDSPVSELAAMASPRDILSASVQKDSLYAHRPPRHVRPSTAGARRPNANGRAIATTSRRAAWEKQGGGSSPRPKRQARVAEEGLDKETLQHKVKELQRQINMLVDDKTRLQAELVRTQQDFNKVLRENEELFRAKAGSAAVKGGASSHLVHNMKRRIKELEVAVANKEEEMKKLKMDTRVTRLTELEVERDAFLQEVRRLQRENRKLAGDMQQIKLGFSVNNEEHTVNYKELYRMYQIVLKDNAEVKKRAETLEAKGSELKESFQIAERANAKLRRELQAAKTSMRKATAGDGGSSEVSRTQQKKGKEEALEKRVKELLANQKRLDLALNRISRERDAAEAGRLEKETEVKRLTEQKKMLQMELHALGANVKTGKKGGGGEPEMMCFYCKDKASNHVRVQFVNARISFADFQDILRRLFDRQGLITFSYEEGGEERRVRDAADFSRCKEEVENSYSGRGDQAVVICLDPQRSPVLREGEEEEGEEGEEGEETEARGVPDGGGQSRLLERAGGEGREKRTTFSCRLRCCYDGETLGEVSIDDNAPWTEFRATLRHVLQDDANFTYRKRRSEEEEEEEEEMVEVTNGAEFASFIASLRSAGKSTEEIFLVRRQSAPFFSSRKEATRRPELQHVQETLRRLSSEATGEGPRSEEQPEDRDEGTVQLQREGEIAERQQEEREREAAQEREREAAQEREREAAQEREREAAQERERKRERERRAREEEEQKLKLQEQQNAAVTNFQNVSELTVELAKPYDQEDQDKRNRWNVKEQAQEEQSRKEGEREQRVEEEQEREEGEGEEEEFEKGEEGEREASFSPVPVVEEGASPVYGNDFEDVRDEVEEEEAQRMERSKTSDGLEVSAVEEFVDDEDPFQVDDDEEIIEDDDFGNIGEEGMYEDDYFE